MENKNTIGTEEIKNEVAATTEVQQEIAPAEETTPQTEAEKAPEVEETPQVEAEETAAVEADEETAEATAATSEETQPQQEEIPAEATPEEPQETLEGETEEAEATAQAGEKPLPTSKEEVIERLRALVEDAAVATKQELDLLKQSYYHFRNAEVAAEHEAYISKGGDPETFQPSPDEQEESFKAELDRVKEIRAQKAQEQEQIKQNNLKRKLEIIELVKTYGESPESADKNFSALRKLQAEWKELKLVPAENATELWKNYQLHIEHFYDQLHLNNEARMYDFKKNLEKKLQLCESAEKLAEVEDPISAFHQLQNLHNEFRETGPVEKEKREEIWQRFKAASTVINKKYQAHFETLKEQEEENLQKKTALCEKIEGIQLEGLTKYAEWEKLTQEVLDIQAEWKTIGFTPRKMNTKIFERFRAACDNFFQKKADFYKNLRETFSANLEQKNQLIEQVEALKESTDWNNTANKIIALQKKWKETGPVAHKVSEAVWKRFNEACNYFFEKKNEATGEQRREEEANLEEKKGVIASLEALLEAGKEDVAQEVRELQEKWNSIGHVPFRKKDKIYKKYREVCDKIYQELHISARKRSVEKFRKNVAEKVGNELSRERQRLQAAVEAKKDEIKTYETNLSFFSSKSKTGNSLVADVEKKIVRLKEELETLVEKYKAAREQERAQDEAAE